MIKRKAKNPLYKKLRPFIKGTVAAVIMLLLTSLLLSLLMCAAGMSGEVAPVMSIIALCSGAVSGGIIIGGNKGKNGFFWGATEGLILFLIILIVALITGNADNNQLVMKLLFSVISSTAGGIIGVNLPID
ncbi:MAG: TIGR04086 family membrane protein [Ruminiclostridium sp.]|nr:TIGR04086 family membrane protein [Ruminiclostridium sp.]